MASVAERLKALEVDSCDHAIELAAIRAELEAVAGEMRGTVLSVPVLLAEGYPEPHPRQIEWAARLAGGGTDAG